MGERIIEIIILVFIKVNAQAAETQSEVLVHTVTSSEHNKVRTVSILVEKVLGRTRTR